MPIEAYSLYWYLLETDLPAAADGDWNELSARAASACAPTARESR
jgi:hypothetical protein